MAFRRPVKTSPDQLTLSFYTAISRHIVGTAGTTGLDWAVVQIGPDGYQIGDLNNDGQLAIGDGITVLRSIEELSLSQQEQDKISNIVIPFLQANGFAEGDGYLLAKDIIEFTDSEMTAMKSRAIQKFAINRSVWLDVVASEGNLGTYYDTRMVAGAYSSSTTAYPAETTTAEPYAVSVGYARMSQSTGTAGSVNDNNTNRKFPLYVDDNGNLQHMTAADFYDTFIYPAISEMYNVDLYQVTTGSTPAGNYIGDYARVSDTPIFSDTRANTGAYTADSIPEAQDQPTTITNYYLYQLNQIGLLATVPMPLLSDNNANLYQMPVATLDALLEDGMRDAALNTEGYRVRYGINVTGNTQGSGWSDTRLNGTGAWNTRFVNADDYRAQEFPNGSTTTISTYYLRQYLV